MWKKEDPTLALRSAALSLAVFVQVCCSSILRVPDVSRTFRGFMTIRGLTQPGETLNETLNTCNMLNMMQTTTALEVSPQAMLSTCCTYTVIVDVRPNTGQSVQ